MRLGRVWSEALYKAMALNILCTCSFNQKHVWSSN